MNYFSTRQRRSMTTAMITYAKKLIGAPYTEWHEGDTCLGNMAPFWAAAGPPPSPERIQAHGICCTGLLNVMCRAEGVVPPLVASGELWAGTTDAWWESMRDVMRPYDPSIMYPRGTILLAPYEGPALEDQGHAGMLLDEGTFLHSWLAGGVSIDASPVDSHEWARYQGAILLEDWMDVLRGGKT